VFFSKEFCDQNLKKIGKGLCTSLGLLLLTACPGASTFIGSTSSSSTSSTSSRSASTSVPTGAKAVRIIFKNTYPNGSFDSAPSAGTPAVPGSGHPATRIFTTENELLASGGPGSTNWPNWFQGLEIGISGSSNSSATNANCARFAASGESASTCTFDDGATTPGCGADSGVFRVSEIDCALGGTSGGTGANTDGVYIRAYFSRNTSYLASYENILAVIEYSASSLRAGATDPTSCFSSGSFSPTQSGCTDYVWQAYLKKNAYEANQPFLLFAPPFTARVDWNTHSIKPYGGGFSTRQIILPLAADSGITIFQLSRTGGISTTTPVNSLTTHNTFQEVCDYGSDGTGNSPYCSGIVFNSITFFRI
jgi:hypothetical protein